jgi:hypothetical protein
MKSKLTTKQNAPMAECFKILTAGRSSCRMSQQRRWRKPALRAVAILRATIDREARETRAELKARQNAGQLNPQERLLAAIFGEIK